MPYPKYTDKEILKIVEITKPRVRTLQEFYELTSFFFWGISVKKVAEMFKKAGQSK